MADTAARTEALETPSGKWSGDENFPVGSWLLPARLRPHIAAYYAIARSTDDIADNPDLSPEEKLRRLDAFEAAVKGEAAGGAVPASAERMRESLAATGLGPRHVIDIIAAFKQDATKPRYADWEDLMGYCMLSASPVGAVCARPARRGPVHLDGVGSAVQCAPGAEPPAGLSGRLSSARPGVPA